MRDPMHGLDLSGEISEIGDVQKAAWLSVLNIERASYLKQFEDGRLTREGFATLETFMATMNAKANILSLEQLNKEYSKEIEKIVKRLMHTEHQKISLFDRVLAFHVSKAYITAQLEVKHSMALFKNSGKKGGAVADGSIDKHAEAMSMVWRLHQSTIDQMSLLLKSVDNFGTAGRVNKRNREKFTKYKTRYALNLVLLKQKHAVEHLMHEGLLDALDGGPLLEQIDKKVEAITLGPLLEKIDRRFERFAPRLYKWIYKPPKEDDPRYKSTRTLFRNAAISNSVVTATRHNSSTPTVGDVTTVSSSTANGDCGVSVSAV